MISEKESMRNVSALHQFPVRNEFNQIGFDINESPTEYAIRLNNFSINPLVGQTE